MLPELYEKYKHLEDLKIFWGGKSKKITNVREYIERYFKNGTKGSYYKDGTIQCYPQKNRGFYDLFFIVKARFKEIAEEELAFHLFSMFEDGVLSVIPCSDVRKPVFYTKSMHEYGYKYIHYRKYMEDGYHKVYFELKYGIELSIIEIFKLANNYEQQQNINN